MYRDVSDFKKRYQPRTSAVKDEKSDLFPDSHSILARWRNHFSLLLNVQGNNDVRQKYIKQPLVPVPSAFEFGTTIENLKRHMPKQK